MIMFVFVFILGYLNLQGYAEAGKYKSALWDVLHVALFFAVYYINPDYVMLLFTEELGRKMIIAAAVLQVAGAVAISSPSPRPRGSSA